MFICRCGNKLEWVDTFDTDGNLQEGYLSEKQEWHCPKCNKYYTIEQTIYFAEKDIKVKNITEEV